MKGSQSPTCVEAAPEHILACYIRPATTVRFSPLPSKRVPDRNVVRYPMHRLRLLSDRQIYPGDARLPTDRADGSPRPTLPQSHRSLCGLLEVARLDIVYPRVSQPLASVPSASSSWHDCRAKMLFEIQDRCQAFKVLAAVLSHETLAVV